MKTAVIEVWKWLGSNLAEIIATCALLFTAYQAYLSRRHNRLSVIPRLVSFGSRNSEDNIGHIKVTLSNKGVGPAVIEFYLFELDRKPQKLKDSREALNFVDSLVGEICIRCSVSSFAPGHVLAAGESLTIMEIVFSDAEGQGWRHIEEMMDRLALRVRYSSLYGEKFNYHSIESHGKSGKKFGLTIFAQFRDI